MTFSKQYSGIIWRSMAKWLFFCLNGVRFGIVYFKTYWGSRNPQSKIWYEPPRMNSKTNSGDRCLKVWTCSGTKRWIYTWLSNTCAPKNALTPFSMWGTNTSGKSRYFSKRPCSWKINSQNQQTAASRFWMRRNSASETWQFFFHQKIKKKFNR